MFMVAVLQTYSLLSNLKNLRVLCLENGGNIQSDEGLGQALSQIKRWEIDVLYTSSIGGEGYLSPLQQLYL